MAASNNCKAKGLDSKAVRAWAKANGYEVKVRGRIHADIIAAYQAAVDVQSR